MKHAARFFEYARKRHQIHLARAAGKPKPWTKDPILRSGRFCNVFREDDKTTVWFRKMVRDPMRGRPEVLLATVVFRMFNRVQTGEAIFCQQMLPSSRFKKNETTAFDIFAATGDPAILRSAVKALMPKGPYVTGAYIISSPPGYDKLEGVLDVLARFWQERQYTEIVRGIVTIGWRRMADELINSDEHILCEPTLENVWLWLKQFDYLGKFHSYEIVTDLRHTALLENAPDIMTWASPGPGARRGLNRVWGRDYDDTSLSREQMIEDMRALLSLAGDRRMWPSGPVMWPRFEMREIEHTLCEFDKYERIRLAQGKLKGKYNG